MRTTAVGYERYRKKHPQDPEITSGPGDTFGWFVVRRLGYDLRIMSSGGEANPYSDWEHVSVSRSDHAVPNWADMCFVKDLFWAPEETVVQFHPKAEAYVNEHPACVHLWKKIGEEYELPPRETLA